MRFRTVVGLAGVGALAVAVARHLRSHGEGGHEHGAGEEHGHQHGHQHGGASILIEGVGVYDAVFTKLLAGFYREVAEEALEIAGPGARVLDIGCGPGQLAVELAQRGLRVTATDLDPAMVERAEVRLAAVDPAADAVVADVAALPFDDGAFDLVVSTLSLHHWGDVPAGAREIARVLAPRGRALVFDLDKGRMPFHGPLPEPSTRFRGTALDVVTSDSWPWPGPLPILRRVELAAR